MAKAPKKSKASTPSSGNSGPLFIAFAALLWATDALFRYPAAHQLDPTLIVTIEHFIGTLILLPVILWKFRDHFIPRKASHGLGTVLIGSGGSALATIFFTASFRTLNPSVAILLQKIQPVLVVLLAMIFLKERPAKSFYLWASISLLAAIVLSFSDFNFSFLKDGLNPQSRGFIYAILAATLWAVATVAGRALLMHVPAVVTTFWRYLAALVTLLLLLVLANPGAISGMTGSQLDPKLMQSIFYMALGPGLLALLSYYTGLARTHASVATFVELLFPVGAIILNAIFLNAALNPIQILASLILLFATTQIHLQGFN